MHSFACADGNGDAGEEEIHCLADGRNVLWYYIARDRYGTTWRHDGLV